MSNPPHDTPPPNPPDAPARRAVVVSFFVPPLGALLGARAWRRARAMGDRSALTLARVAVANGVISTLVIIKLLLLAPRLIAWLQAVVDGAVAP